jgi:hypothetical protein
MFADNAPVVGRRAHARARERAPRTHSSARSPAVASTSAAAAPDASTADSSDPVERARAARAVRAVEMRSEYAARLVQRVLRGRMQALRHSRVVADAARAKVLELIKIGAALQIRKPDLVFVPPLSAVVLLLRSVVLLVRPISRQRDLSFLVATHAAVVLPVLEMAAASLLVDPSTTSSALSASLSPHSSLLALAARIASHAAHLTCSPALSRVWAYVSNDAILSPRWVSPGCELLTILSLRDPDICSPDTLVTAAHRALHHTTASEPQADTVREAVLRLVSLPTVHALPLAVLQVLSAPALFTDPQCLDRAAQLIHDRFAASSRRAEAAVPGATITHPNIDVRSPWAPEALAVFLDHWIAAGQPISAGDPSNPWRPGVFFCSNLAVWALCCAPLSHLPVAPKSRGMAFLKQSVWPAFLHYSDPLEHASWQDVVVGALARLLLEHCPPCLWADGTPSLWIKHPKTGTVEPVPIPGAVALQLSTAFSSSRMVGLAQYALEMEQSLLSDPRLRSGDESNVGIDEDALATAASTPPAGFSGFLKSLFSSSGLATRLARKPPASESRAPLVTSTAASSTSTHSHAFLLARVLPFCELVAVLASGATVAGGGGASARPPPSGTRSRILAELSARDRVLDSRVILNVLAFDPRVGGTRLLSYCLLDALRTDAFVEQLAYQSRVVPESVCALVHTVASVFHRHALVLDELELHDLTAPQPIPKQSLRRLIRFFTDVLAHAFAAPKGWWRGSTASLSAEAPSTAFWPELQRSLSGLLSELHSRHTRSALGDDSIWNVNVHENRPLLVGLLSAAPFAVPFADRAQMFRAMCSQEREALAESPAYRIQVTRLNLFDSTYRALARIPVGQLKRRLAVEFVDEFGMVESGIDAGGLFKDLWTALSSQVFDPAYGMFKLSPQNDLYPNPNSALTLGAADDEAMFRFLGRFLGKALFDGVTVNPQFALFFLAKLLGKPTHLHYLSSLDKALYANLMFVRTYAGDVENDLCLTMVLPNDDELAASSAASASAAASASSSAAGEIPLVPGGESIPVTRENRVQYAFLVADAKLNKSIARQTAAFREGLYELIPPQWLTSFSEPELQVLISGSQRGIDMDDLKAHTRLAGWGWGESTVDMFWDVARSLDDKGKAALLRFVTACERPPPLGFQDLNPPFSIQRVDDRSRLPTASTCFNILKLPAYRSRKELEEKLKTAIFSESGFGLS